ncbi:lytic murein transglycosylase [Desulfovibrio litoralis]|uniref:Transglycosylase SLT domain-containing protein n=1 Tax=Desulfovibrio litoralis DSM 11393 TaxID=1121455 RepID=A0A1M7TJI4_9BACT|nr:lytic murein transglycosylase [Desulfovibrio litoralis]SHN70778.1 Transglycosylase SLT domain-containing protein [Desulfovibrio litoralis DSM 11393]
MYSHKKLKILFCFLVLPFLFSCQSKSHAGSTLDVKTVNNQQNATQQADSASINTNSTNTNSTLKVEKPLNKKLFDKSYVSNIKLEDNYWKNLHAKLAEDNLISPEIDKLFCSLPAYENKAMATKVKELYRIKFTKRTPQANKTPKMTIYPNIVTPENMLKAQTYLEEHKEYFKKSEDEFGVPKEVAVGLLFLETRLGTYLGTDNAVWSLASMASSQDIADVEDTLTALNAKEDQKAWLETKVKEKSAWAYNEFKALVVHCIENDIDSTQITGSVYGAIGFCQFMPSNLKRYAVDGDDDGKVNLFTHPDAIRSLSNFLYKHGWRKEKSRAENHKVLMRYNNSKKYANTILAVADYLNPSLVEEKDKIIVDTSKKVKSSKKSKKQIKQAKKTNNKQKLTANKL